MKTIDQIRERLKEVNEHMIDYLRKHGVKDTRYLSLRKEANVLYEVLKDSEYTTLKELQRK